MYHELYASHQSSKGTAAPVPIVVKRMKKRAIEQLADQMLRVPPIRITPASNTPGDQRKATLNGGPSATSKECFKETKKPSIDLEMLQVHQSSNGTTAVAEAANRPVETVCATVDAVRKDIISSSTTTPSDRLSVADSSVFADSRRSSNVSFIVRERLLSLAQDINRRTNQVKKQIQQPPTPDSVSIASVPETKDEADRHSLKSFVSDDGGSPTVFAQKNNTTAEAPVEASGPVSLPKQLWMRWQKIQILPASFELQSKKYLIWLAIMSVCFLYNAYAVPLRAAYPYQTAENLPVWMIFDYICDLVFLLDMVVFKPRLRFVKGGLSIRDKTEMRAHYLRSWTFKVDLLSLAPLDLLYLVDSIKFSSLVRLPRLLRIQCYWHFFYCVDSMLENPYFLRIGKTLSYMLYLVHCNSCIFYSISIYVNYIRCFYFAFKLGVGIGNNESPTNVFEHLYMTFSWFMGVFVFALLLGQIRDIVATANKNKETFRKAMDAALDHCKSLKLSKPVQDKVRLWFIYTWQEQKTLDETKLIEKLPKKMQTDLAIACHYQTLSKVSLFQDCDKALLRDLVLKLKSVLFLPGDFVCRKGEVGKEMYIVNKGIVEVIGGPKNEVLVTLKEGSVFGEISLLSLSGGNRRTADVISKGFSNLFVLSKDDLHDAIKDYPVAQRVLKQKAKKLLKKNAPAPKEDEIQLNTEERLEQTCVIKSSLQTPRLLQTVIKVIDPTTETAKKLMRSVSRAPEFPLTKEDEVFSEISSVTEDNSDCFNNWQHEMDLDNDDDLIVIESEAITDRRNSRQL